MKIQIAVIRTDRDERRMRRLRRKIQRLTRDSLKVMLNLVVLVAIALVVILAMTPDNAPYWEKLTGASIVAMFFAGISLGVRQVI